MISHEVGLARGTCKDARLTDTLLVDARTCSDTSNRRNDARLSVSRLQSPSSGGTSSHGEQHLTLYKAETVGQPIQMGLSACVTWSEVESSPDGRLSDAMEVRGKNLHLGIAHC